MKSKSLILMVFSLGFGLIAAIGISQVMGNGQSGGAEIERGQVLVAAQSLSHNDDLTEENVKIEHWPVEVIPEGAARSFEEIAHKKITTRLSKELPIMLSDVASPEEIGNIDIPKGMKLVAVKVSSEETLGGLLKPGDHVDLIAVLTLKNNNSRGSSRNRAQTVSETFLKNIVVYSIDGKLSNIGPREGNNSNSAIVGVLVTEKQSEMIVLVQKIAVLRIALRGNYDSDDNQVEFDDFDQFYQSVFAKGAELDKEGDATENSDPYETFKVRYYMGSEVKEFQFQGNQRVSDPNASPEIQSPATNGNSGDEVNDSDDSNQSGDSENGIEEDQYLGE